MSKHPIPIAHDISADAFAVEACPGSFPSSRRASLLAPLATEGRRSATLNGVRSWANPTEVHTPIIDSIGKRATRTLAIWLAETTGAAVPAHDP